MYAIGTAVVTQLNLRARIDGVDDTPCLPEPCYRIEFVDDDGKATGEKAYAAERGLRVDTGAPVERTPLAWGSMTRIATTEERSGDDAWQGPGSGSFL
jgi:hypothetical protein